MMPTEKVFFIPTDQQLAMYEKQLIQTKPTVKLNSRKYRLLEEKTSVNIPLGITDIDSNYYSDISGRPVKEKFSKQGYLKQIRQGLKTNIAIGFNDQECIRIDHQLNEERKRISSVEKCYNLNVKNFENYLAKDHEKSMKIMEEAEQVLAKSNELMMRRDELKENVGQISRDIYKWEEKWTTVKMCYEFIQMISEQSESNDCPKKVDDSLRKERSVSKSSSSLENIIESFEDELRGAYSGKGEINLFEPRQLLEIFNKMELRNLDALIHLKSLASPIAEMSSSLADTEELIKSEISSIEERLDELKLMINSIDERTQNLEEYADYLINNVLKDLVSSEAVLYLKVFIEDAYESCIGPNDAKLDGYSMMRAIDKTYESLNMILDNLPTDIVKQCEKEGFDRAKQIMKTAEDAAKKYDLMNRLLKALERIMAPPKMK